MCKQQNNNNILVAAILVALVYVALWGYDRFVTPVPSNRPESHEVDDKGRCIIDQDGNLICVAKENKDGVLQATAPINYRRKRWINIGDNPIGEAQGSAGKTRKEK